MCSPPRPIRSQGSNTRSTGPLSVLFAFLRIGAVFSELLQESVEGVARGDFTCGFLAFGSRNRPRCIRPATLK